MYVHISVMDIDEIIERTRDKDLLLFSNFTNRKVHEESKNFLIWWHCSVKKCMTKVYTFLENIVKIVETVNEYNGHGHRLTKYRQKMFWNGCKKKL